MIDLLLNTILVAGCLAVFLLMILALIMGIQHYRFIKKRRKSSSGRLKSTNVFNQHMDMLSELNSRQQDIAARIEEPSKNALHSKHKNFLIQAVRDIEEEKFTIMLTILLMGHDPMIAYIDGRRQRHEMKMSDYLNHVGPPNSNPSATNTLKPVPNLPESLDSKSDFKYNMRPRLRLVKGGKAETTK